MKDLILIGGGGHCKACIDVIQTSGSFNIIGIFDAHANIGNAILGIPIIGTDDEIENYARKGVSFHISIGGVKAFGLRSEIFEKLQSFNCDVPVIVSSNAYVSAYAQLGKGTIVMHHAVVNANAIVGENNILNTQSLIEHDAVVGNNCHIATKSVVNGTVKVGNNVYLGSNSTLLNNIEIANDSVIGASSVVIKNITQKGVYVGNPTRRIS